MKELLNCFDYIKRYHTDMLDSIAILLECVWVKRRQAKELDFLILQGNKRKSIYEAFSQLLEHNLGQLYTPINPKCNVLKILKVIHNHSLNDRELEELLHIITQKKTAHKLFYYSTPLEINEFLVGLLDIKDNQSVYNPCYGMGSLFFLISQAAKHISLYGEELEQRLNDIAKLVCKVLELDSTNLATSNVLANVYFKDIKFDKIICNPPLHSHIGTQFLRKDERFATYEALIKTYPELLFLIHSLNYLKDKGVFILRNQTLQKSSTESRLREQLCEDRLIESIIELPKNIFPHQSYDFSIIVLSQNNKDILHINANSPHFFKKDGKYNRLINIDTLLDIFKNRKVTQHSTLTPLHLIDSQDLRVQNYIYKDSKNLQDSISLRELGVEIFRGQRVYGSTKDSKISYFDLGLADFSEYGFSSEFSTKRFKGELSKINKYKLKAYDIALSIRGTTPKFTILSPEIENKLVIANAGIIIIRAKSIDSALGIYCYLFSHAGQKVLSSMYEWNESSISSSDLESLRLPKDYTKQAKQIFSKIQSLANELKRIESSLQDLR